jgi:Glycosyl hydrolase 108
MSYFDLCFQNIIMNPSIEGGAKYVNNPKDPGGETKYGIAKRSHQNVNIAALTQQEAQSIYEKEYWSPLSLEGQPYNWALVTFDCAVNQGVGTARILRETSPTIPIFMAKRALKYAKEPQEQLAAFGLGWMTRLFLVMHLASSPSPQSVQ